MDLKYNDVILPSEIIDYLVSTAKEPNYAVNESKTVINLAVYLLERSVMVSEKYYPI